MKIQKEPLAVLLLCETNLFASRLAEILLSAEAGRMEINCTVASRGWNVGEQSLSGSDDLKSALDRLGLEDEQERRQPLAVTISDLENAKQVVILGSDRDETLESLRERLPDWKQVDEFWKVSSDPNQMVEEIRSNVSKLAVALILQGGKRPALAEPEPEKQKVPPGKQGKVRVFLDRKKRKGKKVTVISGLELDESDLRELAGRLKTICGTGGTVKDGQIEIQGDKRDQVLSELQKQGYKAKRSGG